MDLAVPYMGTKSPGPVDQEIILDDAQTKALQNAALMRASLEGGNVRDALKYASDMIAQLKTPDLSPKHYYILFMQIFNNLKELEDFFLEEKKKGRRMSDLYEAVQQASDVLQRLYLMVTAGSAYIGSKEATAKEILKDLIEMAKGIQHPIRGLFLRYFMLKKLKERFPDKGGQNEGDVMDSASFMLQNLSEMNRLWIRMQHTGAKDKARREAERNELNMVVGENIVRLSSLEGVDLEIYKSVVLPKLLELIHSCKDPISQQYLMDCIIQVFADDFHLHTLEKLLEACTNLHSGVDVKLIFITLMERLANFAATQNSEIAAVDKEINIFAMFKKAIDRILEEQGAIMDLKKLIELEVAFIRFSIKSYPDKIDYVNAILESAAKIIQIQPAKSITTDCLKSLVKLLTIPLETLSLAVLNMSQFPVLMQYLNLGMKKDVAKQVLQALIVSRKKLNSLDTVQKLLTFIDPLIVGLPGQDDAQEELYEFEEVQSNVAKVAHLLNCPDVQQQFAAISKLKEVYGKGGNKRMKITYPAIVWALYRLGSNLGKKASADDVSVLTPEDSALQIKIFELAGQVSEAILPIAPELSVKLLLQGVLTMSETGTRSEELEKLAGHYMNQALMVYQDELADSDLKYKVITLVIGTLERTTLFSGENFAALAKRTIQFCTKLLKKQDQCKAILMCTHMFASEDQAEPENIEECLNKSYNLCMVCKVTKTKSTDLYTMLLNKYIYYYEKFDIVKAEQIKKLIEEADAAFKETVSEEVADALKFYKQTLAVIKFKAASNEKFKALQAQAGSQ